MTLTVRYTPPGAPDSDSIHVKLHAAPGARIELHLPLPNPRDPTDTDPQTTLLPTDHDQASPWATTTKPEATAKDWELPWLPADCAPGTEPLLLTDAQAAARLRYGYEQGWAQRRIGAFAGRAPATVHKYVERFRAETNTRKTT
ncbi:hypothetical protein [Streptomyces sp. 8L]|uniref:hypothetical protein n=1 Tax=Streptomyces sp. 8L TaxID=2877242 RepID=UPI001CD4A3CC|nr:hypothetical protein [Streptomyces sp. 8L]MCA1224068.1 hypothetical protein [Streptomyces sp. 8L]